jgi:uncharacterized protein RhaS with RHS repeats
MGGVNLYQYAPNPVGWVDPLGLSSDCPAFEKENRVPLDSETILANKKKFTKTKVRVKGATVYKGNDKNYYHRDTLHTGVGAELEVYNKKGNHIGTANPITGEIDTTHAVPGRKISVK